MNTFICIYELLSFPHVTYACKRTFSARIHSKCGEMILLSISKNYSSKNVSSLSKPYTYLI